MTTQKGYVRRCMDKRFGEGTREAFEQVSGLGPEDYWDQSNPGGAAEACDPKGLNYAVEHGATVFGWQAHLDRCGGLPENSDDEIITKLNEQIALLQAQYPGKHYQIIASEDCIQIAEV